MKTKGLLPDEIRYLQPFLRWLGKFPPEQLDESVDSSRLEKALKKRLCGLTIDQAQEQLDKDRHTLESWLKSYPEGHPAHWVLGWLMHPDLARSLLQPEPEAPPAPVIEFEPPPGWRMRAIPFNLNLRKGKLRAFIFLLDELGHRLAQLPGKTFPPGTTGRVEEHDIIVGASKGRKYVWIQAAPVFKQVDYVLAVPGGFVNVMLDRTDFLDFDELPFEVQLRTLRVVMP